MWERFKELELKLEGQYDTTVQEHVQYPVYTDNYEDALRTIFWDVLWKESLCKADKDYEFDTLNRETANMIAFLGERGSGKTTAMEEFCRILKSLSKENEYLWWLKRVVPEEDVREKLEKKRFCFHVFSRIDVSMLENKEDLFELIMSNLLCFFQEKERNCCAMAETRIQKDDVLKQFERILKAYYAIRDSREDEFIDSYIAKVQYISGSLMLQTMIDELLQMIFYQGKFSEDQHYLVIVLDDLDLNVEHGFEMLKQMQKYFASPHIIITISADYKQLNEICWIHFVKAFSAEKSHVIEEKVEEKCRELGRDYIGKALPISKRIYMPDLNSDTRNILVLNDSKEGDTVKQYVMRNMSRKMNILYDIKGKKRHFAEPENVRGLVSYHRFLDELYDIDFKAWEKVKKKPDQSRIYMERYDQNHERINMDIVNRLANHLLSDQQKKEFYQWLDIRLERRPESACVYMGSWLKQSHNDDMELVSEMDSILERDRKTGKRPRSQINDSSERSHAQNDPVQEYRYGDLMERIYEYGRESRENKAYVKCVLASLTSEMVRERVCFTRNPDHTRREASKQILLRLAGKAFGSSWIGDMMPGRKQEESVLFTKEVSGTRNLGYQELIAGNEMTKNLCLIPTEVFGKRKEKTFTEIDEIIGELTKIMEENKLIPSLEWMFFFLNTPEIGASREAFPIRFEIVELKNTTMAADAIIDGTDGYVLQLKFENINVSGSILEMIPKTLVLKEYLAMLHRKISQKLTEALISNLGLLDTEMQGYVNKKLLEQVEKSSMIKGKETRPIFPFYQVDYAYNILKRTRRELQEDNPETCDKHEWLDYLKKAYEKLIDKMKEEEGKEEGYGKIGVNLDYSERFSKFYFVWLSLNDQVKEQINKEIVDIVHQIFYGETGAIATVYAEGE